MWYKLEDNGNWLKASTVVVPYNGELITLNNDNEEMELVGWKWYEVDPIEYTNWLENQEDDEQI